MDKMQRDSFLSDDCPPMGIYETLYAFRDTFGQFMGAPGTHPWSQGFPLTTQLPGGPPLPSKVDVTWEDRFYPKAWGHPALREAICAHYNDFYGSSITPDNVMISAGGRPGLYAVLSFLKRHVEVRIAGAEWPAYLDILAQTEVRRRVVPSNEENGFHPPNAAYFDRAGLDEGTCLFPVLSNPGNPTGHTRTGAELEELMALAEQPGNGILLDEAYEMFHASRGVSGIRHVKDLDESNVFLAGACTKGLQCPGIRIGWIIASKRNVETLSNFSSFGMGGVSHPSQLYAAELLEPKRVAQAREAVAQHYGHQRERYGAAFRDMGLGVHTGDGGFYHWLKLPEGLDAGELNRRLFKHGAAILEGRDCDMARPHDKDPAYVSPYLNWFRFSFGPLLPETFESDVELFGRVLDEYRADVAASGATAG